MVDGALLGGAGGGQNAKHVKIVALPVGGEQEATRRVEGHVADGASGVRHKVRHDARDVVGHVDLAAADAVQVQHRHDARLRRRAGTRRRRRRHRRPRRRRGQRRGRRRHRRRRH